VDYLREEHQSSIRRACRLVSISQSVYRYSPNTDRDNEVIAGIRKAVARYPAYGFGKVCEILRRWNYKRVHRLYCLLSLNKRRRGKKQLASRPAIPLACATTINACWWIDFMSDSLFCGRRFRTFNVVDDYSRETLAIEIDIRLPSEHMIKVLE
jgi:putative transposase